VNELHAYVSKLAREAGMDALPEHEAAPQAA
jgi:hypothetical protein